MLRGVLEVLVMRPKVDGVVIVIVGVPITTWFMTLVIWTLKSAPTPSRNVMMVLWTARSRFQRGTVRMASPPQLPSKPRTHLRNSASTAAGSANWLTPVGLVVPTAVVTPLITPVVPALL